MKSLAKSVGRNLNLPRGSCHVWQHLNLRRRQNIGKKGYIKKTLPELGN